MIKFKKKVEPPKQNKAGDRLSNSNESAGEKRNKKEIMSPTTSKLAQKRKD